MAARIAFFFSLFLLGVSIGLLLNKIGIHGRYTGFAILGVYLGGMMIFAPRQARKEPWLRLFYSKRPDDLPPGY